ncbi:MAG TPA: hypothetical protein VHX38_05020 [Pseudonocardiaceae bacterium]|nr:hypothetical protein [Pseudonocardiaceae bacterium]
MVEPNKFLRAARERTPSRRAPGESMGRAELAEAVCEWLWQTTQARYDLDRHTIARYERGVVRWPRPPYRSGLRHVLGVCTDAELGFGETSVAPVATMAGSTADRGTGPELEAVLMDAAGESARFLEIAEASNVGELTVEQLHTDVRRIAHAYLKVPTLPLFARTRALRDRAFTLLAGRQRPHQTRDLYAAAGWALTVLAWISVDLGKPDAAEDHARAAWACADNADHAGLRAWVRATQHTAAFWQDDYQRAAGYAEDGQRYATGTAATFLASAHALDLARAGEAPRARLLLQRAQEIAQTAEPEPDELGGPFTCPTDRAGSLWSDTYLALGEASAALTIAQRAVARFEAAPAESRNLGSERMTRIQVAKAHLAGGDLDGAAEALSPVLATAPEHRVRPLLHRVGEVGALVAQSGHQAPVADTMLAGIAEFGQHPVVAELTA